jgi:hypothetical protein
MKVASVKSTHLTADIFIVYWLWGKFCVLSAEWLNSVFDNDRSNKHQHQFNIMLLERIE